MRGLTNRTGWAPQTPSAAHARPGHPASQLTICDSTERGILRRSTSVFAGPVAPQGRGKPGWCLSRDPEVQAGPHRLLFSS